MGFHDLVEERIRICIYAHCARVYKDKTGQEGSYARYMKSIQELFSALEASLT